MPEPPKKTREQLLREQVNAQGVEIVQNGFDAIDRLAEIGKRELKKAILKALTGKRPRR